MAETNRKRQTAEKPHRGEGASEMNAETEVDAYRSYKVAGIRAYTWRILD